jgi:hypothetical protein
MIALDEAILVLKGWESRRLRVIFKGLGVEHLSAVCDLYAVSSFGASFVAGKDVGFALDFTGCIAEYAEPPKDAPDEGAEAGIFFRRADFSITIFTFVE